MTRRIYYAYDSILGLVRRNHEDNFFIDGHRLEESNTGTHRIHTGIMDADSMTLVGIFDGMGGEAAGETAAYLAAATLDQENEGLSMIPEDAVAPVTYEAYLDRLCRKMNDRVCAYASQHRIRSMGSTAAYLLIGKGQVSCANVGDSRIYRFRKGKLAQLSKDHVQKSFFYRKGGLTQYLGIPSDEIILQPHMVTEDYVEGTVYLLCTDGVTDMLDDKKLETILAETEDPGEMIVRMEQEILRNGAKDNATMIVLKV